MHMDNHKEELVRQFLRERFGTYKDDMGAEEPLKDMVDSLGLFELLTFVEQTFSISISDDHFSPEYFSTIGSIVRTIEKFQQV